MALSEAERFAGLIDAPPLNSAARPQLNGAAEPAPSHQGKTSELLTLVAALRELDFDIAPSEQTRHRQRQRLVAMAAVRSREVADEAEAGRHRAFGSAADTAQDSVWSQVLVPLRKARSGRSLVAGLAGLSVIVATLGILSLLAQSAIPGDTLYPLKHGTEQARLVLAGDEQAEGRVLLGFASTRLEELSALLDAPVSLRAGGSGVQAANGGDVSELLLSTMETMDRQTTDGTSALTTAAMDDSEAEILSFVGLWGVEQFETLSSLASRMPEEVKARAELSKDLLQEIVQRLDGLAQIIDCSCLSESPSTDALGPVPCSDCVSDPSAEPTSQASSSPGQSDPAPGPSASPTSTIPGPSPPPGDPGDPGVPIPPVDPTLDPTVEPTVGPPIPPPPPLEGSACVTAGGLSGTIQGGVCVALPIEPPPDPNEGQPCVLVDLPWPLDDIMGIIVGGICVIG